MKISYNYEEMIQELKEDVSDGVLLLTDAIQILRSDYAIDNDGYKPIIDWYYNHKRTLEILKSDFFDDEHDLEELRKSCEFYEKDRFNLVDISVEDCLLEMEERNKII